MFESAWGEVGNPQIGPETAFEEPRRDRYPQVGQHPATPRQIHWAVLRPLLTCGSLIDKFCLTPQAPPLP